MVLIGYYVKKIFVKMHKLFKINIKLKLKITNSILINQKK